MIKIIDSIHDDKSIWLLSDGFCLIERTPFLRYERHSYSCVADMLEKVNAFFTDGIGTSERLAVIVANDVPAIVPRQMAEQCDLAKILAVQCDSAKIAATFDAAVEDYHFVYYINEREKNVLALLPGEKKYFPLCQVIYEYIQKNQHPENLLFLSVVSGHLDMLLLKDNHLSLVNRYAWSQSEDVLYALLNVKKQYQLPENLTLWLRISDEFFSVKNLLGKYIADIVYVE